MWSSYFESLDYISQKCYVEKLKMREIEIPDPYTITDNYIPDPYTITDDYFVGG